MIDLNGLKMLIKKLKIQVLKKLKNDFLVFTRLKMTFKLIRNRFF